MLAHKALAPGSFRWMLFGDDDTIFFVDSVLEFLQDFDPDLPYFISGGALAPWLPVPVRRAVRSQFVWLGAACCAP